MNRKYEAPANLGTMQRNAIGIGLIGIIAWVLLSVTSGPGKTKETFFHSYLVGFVFWCGIALGCLGWLMVQYLGGATWGLMIRRLLESGAHTLILMLLLFLPIAFFGLSEIYEWADYVVGSGKPILDHKSSYLNPKFFVIRSLGYFAIWIFLMIVLRKNSHKLDETGDPKFIQSSQNWSGPGFVIYGICGTFAAVDWIMSLDAEWYSTIFGLLMIVGQGLLAMAMIIVMCVKLGKSESMHGVYQPKHFHDLGKLMLALVMVWTYFSFSQLLIIWSGNLTEEIPWYLERFKGNWRYIGMGLILFQFAFPFSLLLSRDLKRDARKLVFVACLIIFVRFVDLLWLIVPEFEHGKGGSVTSYIVYACAVIGIGGIWFGWFLAQLKQRALISVNDPLLPEALAAGGHH